MERITGQASDRLDLLELDPGCTWVTLSLPTSNGRSWLIYARYAPSLVFLENTLCVEHAIVRGAIINAAASPPRMALQGSVYELHQSEADPVCPLYLQLPLQPSDLFMPELQTPSFLPETHWLHESSADPTLVGDIARQAGLEHPRDMQRWANHYLRSNLELEQWLLGDILGVQHHTHLPWLLRTTSSRGDSNSDSDGRRTMHPAGAPESEPLGMSATTFHRSANLPRTRVGVAGIGAVRPPRYPGDASIHNHEDAWWRCAEGVVDMTASRPFMSLAFAKSLGHNRESLDTWDAGEITELNFRPGGWNLLSHQPHRTRFWGLGTLIVRFCFSRDEAQPYRVLDVEFMVF